MSDTPSSRQPRRPGPVAAAAVESRRRRLALPLATARLQIREFAAADLEALQALYCDTRITRHMLYGPRDAEGTERHLAGILRRQGKASRDSWELGVEDPAGPRLIGACELVLHPGHEAEIGYLLAPDRWGRGLGTEIAVALVRAAFEQLRAGRVLSTVEIHNTPSIKVLDKAGLRWEATLRRHAQVRRNWWDVHLFAVSREDWALANR